jgi:hypothetical protein
MLQTYVAEYPAIFNSARALPTARRPRQVLQVLQQVFHVKPLYSLLYFCFATLDTLETPFRLARARVRAHT